jgi:hypothetical protein
LEIIMAKVAYKAKYEEGQAQIAELRAMVEKLVAAQGTVSAPTPVKTATVKAQPARKKAATKAVKPANEGTMDHIVLINPESGEMASGIEDSIRSNKHGDNVNFTFCSAPDSDGNVATGKPVPALLDRVREVNTFRGRGYVHSAKRWFMNRQAFETMVADFDVTVFGS